MGDTELLAGFTWQDVLHDVVARVGSLAAVAERLAHDNGFADDVGSIERGLRRLRARGHQAGGKWGARLLACFGLPGSVEARLRWMASYHSRFTDLPVPVAADLLRLWDHPPTTDRREARACLALARASIELRKRDHVAALRRLDGVVRELDRLPPELRTSVRTRRLGATTPPPRRSTGRSPPTVPNRSCSAAAPTALRTPCIGRGGTTRRRRSHEKPPATQATADTCPSR